MTASPDAASARLARAMAWIDRRWLRTERRSRISTRAYPARSSRTRGWIVPVYGTMRRSAQEKSAFPPGFGERRVHRWRMRALTSEGGAGIAGSYGSEGLGPRA